MFDTQETHNYVRYTEQYKLGFLKSNLHTEGDAVGDVDGVSDGDVVGEAEDDF